MTCRPTRGWVICKHIPPGNHNSGRLLLPEVTKAEAVSVAVAEVAFVSSEEKTLFPGEKITYAGWLRQQRPIKVDGKDYFFLKVDDISMVIEEGPVIVGEYGEYFVE